MDDMKELVALSNGPAKVPPNAPSICSELKRRSHQFIPADSSCLIVGRTSQSLPGFERVAPLVAASSRKMKSLGMVGTIPYSHSSPP